MSSVSFKMQKVVFVCIFAIVCQTAFTVGYERTWNLRQKRMTNDDECQQLLPEPGKKMPPTCCQLPTLLPGMDNAWGKCFEILKQIKDKPDSKEYKEMVHGNDPPCLFQCLFMHSGLVDRDGKINEDAVTKKFNEGINNDEKWKSLWKPILDKCFEEVKDESKQTTQKKYAPAGRLMKCFLTDLYLSCPKDVWVDSKECMNMKNLVQKCPEMPPPVFKPPPVMIQ